MSEDKILRAMRTMAWERAKGELRAMFHTYYSSNASEESYEEFDKATEKFIKKVEDNGWEE